MQARISNNGCPPFEIPRSVHRGLDGFFETLLKIKTIRSIEKINLVSYDPIRDGKGRWQAAVMKESEW